MVDNHHAQQSGRMDIEPVHTFAKMKARRVEPQDYLDDNDATAFFEASGDLLLPGPTLTNVNDIRVILVD